MKRSVALTIALLGVLLLAWGIFDGTYREIVAGAALMGGAFFAAFFAPPRPD
jgi:hypothetical protein